MGWSLRGPDFDRVGRKTSKLGEGLLLSSHVARCVAGIVRESPGSRDPAGRTVTIVHDCEADERRSLGEFRTPDMVRKFAQSQQASVIAAVAGLNCVAAGQRLAG